MKKFASLALIAIAVFAISLNSGGAVFAQAWEVVVSSHRFVINGEAVEARALNINGRNYISVADFAELLDIGISYDADTNTVYLGRVMPFSTNERVSENQSMNTATIIGQTWYLVETEVQLRSIGNSTYSLSANYILNANIKLTDEWIPIGTLEAPFTGRFDGNGHEIVGLTITNPNLQFVGMFGVAENAIIRNVTLRDFDISSGGRDATGKSVAPVLAFSSGNTESFDHTLHR